MERHVKGVVSVLQMDLDLAPLKAGAAHVVAAIRILDANAKRRLRRRPARLARASIVPIRLLDTNRARKSEGVGGEVEGEN